MSLCWSFTKVFQKIVVIKNGLNQMLHFAISFPPQGFRPEGQSPRRPLLRVYVVVQFYPWYKFYFPLFWGMVMYDDEFKTKENKI